jgi:anti-sigma-K factor RskA
MEADTLHDLTAAYSLDALDPEDAREYEAHLARCERCREELASLSDAASALAYATEAPTPPPELRARILQQAARERSNVVPLRPNWARPVAAVAAVAACAALGLGIWAASLSSKLDSRTEALSEQERVAAILAEPASRRIPIEGGQGTLVVTPMGQGVLVLNRLRPADSGRTYEAWIARGRTPEPAGTFDGEKSVDLVLLKRPVTEGSAVMVTEERAGGVDAPTGHPFVTVQYPVQS